MKADMLLLCVAGGIAGVFLYVLMAGLTVRFINSMYGQQSCEQEGIVLVFWPFAIPIALLVWVGMVAHRLSQWRPRRKSTLPGARVVR